MALAYDSTSVICTYTSNITLLSMCSPQYCGITKVFIQFFLIIN